MEKEVEKKRRPRRSQVAIERDILESVVDIVRESGFSKVSLITVAEKANVQLSVIYRHFGSMDQLLDRYVQSLDYWLNGALNLGREETLPPMEFYQSTLQQLMISLYKSQEMQRLLVWESSEDSAITRRTLKRRELVNTEMVHVFERLFSHANIDISALTAVLVGGIYYITVNRKQSKFCDIDFATKAGRDRLHETIGTFCQLIFASVEEKHTAKNIARRLKESGVALDIICKATNLTKEEFE